MWSQVVRGVMDGVLDVALTIPGTDITKKDIVRAVPLLRSCRHSNIVQVGMADYQQRYCKLR